MSPAPRRSLFALVALVSGAAAGGCILDLDNLAGGPPRDGGGGSGAGGDSSTETTTGSSTTAANSGGTGGGKTCSPLECGACEGACPEGGCPAVVLANGPELAATPLGIAVAAGALYWVNQTGNTILRLSDESGAPEVLTEATGPRAIAAGADLVVWTTDDGVWACPPGDCKAKKLAAPVAPGSLREVAYDGATVFWSDGGTAESASDGVVMRCSPDDCQPVAIATAQMAPAGISILGDTLFWTTQGDGFPSGHIFKNLKLAQGSTELAAGLILPTGLATDEIHVYWTQWTTQGKVLRCAHSQGFCQTENVLDAMPAAGALGHPRDVAVAGGRLYVSTADDGAIRSCPAPGCSPGQMPRLHTTGQQGLHRMVVGATCVFFTDETNGGSVMKVAR